jgi:magnesium-transporting ATPase (P-type)
MDPLRAEIIGSVDKVSAAGIQVIMCTGDNIDTASAISRSAGILTEEDVAAMAVTDEDFKKPKSQWTDAQKYTAMEGEDFRAEVGHKLKTIEEQVDGKTVKKKSVGHVRNFKKIIKHLKVLARSSPEDK